MKLASGNVTSKNIQIATKKTCRAITRASKVTAYQFHPHTVKRRVRYMSKCRCLKAAPINPEEEGEEEDEIGAVGEKRKKRKREGEVHGRGVKCSDSKDKNDEDEKERSRARRGRETRSGRSRDAAAIAKKKAAEVEAKKMRNPLIRAYRMMFGGPEQKISDLERRRAEAKKNKEKMMKEEANQEKAMEMLFMIREKQRAAKNAMNDAMALVTGKGGGYTEEYTPDDLIRVSRMGDYNSVIDILDHIISPVGPNQVNNDGESAFFTIRK